MRQWRVGSFSLGLTLLLAGLAATSFKWTGNAEFGFFGIIRWWPAVLILLGLEITVAGFFAGHPEPRLKYDWVSLVAIVGIIGLSVCLEAAGVTGFLDQFRSAIQSSAHRVAERQVASIPAASAERAVVTCTRGELEVRTSTGDHVVILGGGCVTARSSAEALEWAGAFKVLTHTEGDTLYISLQVPPVENQAYRPSPEEKWIVLVPAALCLDLSSVSDVDIVARQLSADWLVATQGSVAVTLGADENLNVLARTRSYNDITGNVAWKNEMGQAKDTAGSGSGPEPMPVHHSETWVMKTATLGRGTHTLHIRSSRDVLVEVPAVTRR